MNRAFTIACLLMVSVLAAAQTPLASSPMSVPTLIAPKFFGPNSFPVPQMVDAAQMGQLQAEVAAEGYIGFAADYTIDAFARLSLPLFTNRAQLTVWMPVYEWWHNTAERQSQMRLLPTDPISGSGAGDVFISTDIKIIEENFRSQTWVPAIIIRAALRTASGGDYQLARHYDSPGYFFDLALDKHFQLRNDWQLNAALSGGFLCWQTDNGRQNDAVMYAVKVAASYKSKARLSIDYRGYAGWEKEGDRPMVIAANASGIIKGFEPFIEYQYGLNDYPFHLLRLGLTYHLQLF